MPRDGLARALGKALPHLRWINGGLILLVSAYLVYYWSVALFASPSTRANDPVVGFMDTITATTQRWIDTGGGWWLLAGALIVISAAILVPLWRWVVKPDDIADARSDPTTPAPAVQQPECDCATEPPAVQQFRSGRRT